MADETPAASRNIAQKVGLFLGPGLFLIIVLF